MTKRSGYDEKLKEECFSMYWLQILQISRKKNKSKINYISLLTNTWVIENQEKIFYRVGVSTCGWMGN